MAAAKKNISDNMKIYEGHREPPKEALKTIQAGRLKGMSDINPMWRIKALTEEFGPCGIGWYYTVDKQWIEPCGNESVAFVNISLYIKENDEWSKPIFGTGGSKIIAIERSGPFVSDEAYKMATTDAISVACKQLGLAADVYWNSDRTKYTNPSTEDAAKTKQPTQSSNVSTNKADAKQEQTAEKESNEPTAEELAAADPESVDKDLIPKPGKLVTKEQIKRLESEMDRTGIPLQQILKMAQIDSLNKMPNPTYCAIMSKFSKTPSKELKDKKE